MMIHFGEKYLPDTLSSGAILGRTFTVCIVFECFLNYKVVINIPSMERKSH